MILLLHVSTLAMATTACQGTACRSGKLNQEKSYDIDCFNFLYTVYCPVLLTVVQVYV
jgi:hypothetical protein